MSGHLFTYKQIRFCHKMTPYYVLNLSHSKVWHLTPAAPVGVHLWAGGKDTVLCAVHAVQVASVRSQNSHILPQP